MKGWNNSNSPRKSLIRDLSNNNEDLEAKSRDMSAAQPRTQPPRPYQEHHVPQTVQIRLPLHAPKALGQRGERKSIVHESGSTGPIINLSLDLPGRATQSPASADAKRAKQGSPPTIKKQGSALEESRDTGRFVTHTPERRGRGRVLDETHDTVRPVAT